jgi:hypothetical protein
VTAKRRVEGDESVDGSEDGDAKRSGRKMKQTAIRE